MFDRFLLCQIKPELFLHLYNYSELYLLIRNNLAHLHDSFIRLELDVGYRCVNHERNKVNDQAGTFAQVGKGSEAQFLETLKVWRLHSTHCIDHLFRKLHSRWVKFWVSTENVAKVDCKEGSARFRRWRANRPWKKLPSGESSRLSRCRSPTPSR